MRELVIPTFYSLSEPPSELLRRLAEAAVLLVELHGDDPDTHIDLMDKQQVDALAEVVAGLPVVSKNSFGFQDARAASLVVFSALADTPVAGGYRGWKGMLSGEWTGSN